MVEWSALFHALLLPRRRRDRRIDSGRETAESVRVIFGDRIFGTTNDAHHMTAPRPDGAQAARSMQMALDDAAVDPGAALGVEAVPAEASAQVTAVRVVRVGELHAALATLPLWSAAARAWM